MHFEGKEGQSQTTKIMPLQSNGIVPHACNGDHKQHHNFQNRLSTMSNGSPIEKEHHDSIIDKIFSHSPEKPFFSLEFLPPRRNRANEEERLFKCLDHMSKGGPLFVDVTWHSSSNSSPTSATDNATTSYGTVEEDDRHDSVNIAGLALSKYGLDTVLHLTCFGQSEETIKGVLDRVIKRGIRHLLILRGDLPDSSVKENMTFPHPVDLIRYIRSYYNGYFKIGVAGYPIGHPESECYEDDLHHLKGKIEAGAEFVVTQLFFHSMSFVNFVRDVRRIGITVPIIPGIFPIQSSRSLDHIEKYSGHRLSKDIEETIRQNEGNPKAIRNFGIDHCVKMCREILERKASPGLHFYTLNLELVTREVLRRLGLWGRQNLDTSPIVEVKLLENLKLEQSKPKAKAIEEGEEAGGDIKEARG